MSDVNLVVLSGRLAADPELKFTPKGTAVVALRLASNRFYRDKAQPDGELKKSNLFITASTFGKLAERVAALKKKGDPILVKGRLELNQWTGNDGRARQDFRLFAEDVTFIGRTNGNGQAAEGEPAASTESGTMARDDENEEELIA